MKVIPEVHRVYLIRDLRFNTALQFNYFILDDIAEIVLHYTHYLLSICF
jgi:hypothetical protein